MGNDSDENHLTESDSIFNKSTNTQFDALVNFNHDMSHGYIEGYRIHARIGVQHAIADRNQDYLIYPIVYSYRHHLELSIKRLIVRSDQVLENNYNPPFGHSLVALFSRLKKNIDSIYTDIDKSEFLHASRIVSELHNLDPKGEDFRYHLKTDNKTTTLQGVERLSIESLFNCLEKVSSLLEAVDSDLCHRLELMFTE